MSKDDLQLRKDRKAKKPNFVRHKVHTKPRLAKVWRRPKGLQNKLRLGRKGYGRKISVGYGSPKSVYGLNSEGLEKVMIYNLAGLENIDVKTQGIIIGSSVGNKKRIEIAKQALEKGINILSMKDAQSFIKDTEEKRISAKKDKEEKKKQKLEKAKESEKKAKPKKEEKMTQEEKKKEEKEVKDQILISGS